MITKSVGATVGGTNPRSVEPTCLNPHVNTSAGPLHTADSGRMHGDSVDLRDASGPASFLLCLERCGADFPAGLQRPARLIPDRQATAADNAIHPGTEGTRFRAEIAQAHTHSVSALALLNTPAPRIRAAGALLEMAIMHIWHAAEQYDRTMPVQPRGYFRFGHLQRESFHAAWAAESALSRARTAGESGDIPTAISALEFATRKLGSANET